METSINEFMCIKDPPYNIFDFIKSSMKVLVISVGVYMLHLVIEVSIGVYILKLIGFL